MQHRDCVTGDVALLEEAWGNSVQVITVQDYTRVPSDLAEDQHQIPLHK